MARGNLQFWERLADTQSRAMWITREGIPDHDLSTQLSSFVAVSEDNSSSLGLTLSEIAEMREAFEEFEESLTAVMTARAAFRAAVTAKIDRRERAQKIVSKYAKQWRANDAIPDELLATLMVAPHNPVVTRPPVATVSNLNVSADSNGQIRLKWDANGNLKGTTYIVETSTSGAGPWVAIDAVTKKTFKCASIPGVPVWFRVTAKRAGRTGIPCNAVAMWLGGVSMVYTAA